MSLRRPSTSTSLILLAIVVVVLLVYYFRSRWGDSPDILHGNAGRARSASYNFSPKQVVSTQLAEAPVIDGKLDEPLWSKTARIDDFVTLDTLAPAGSQTEVSLGHHGDVLYVGFRCEEPPQTGTAEIPATAGEQDPEKDVDAIEFYFSPSNDHTRYFRVHVDAKGEIRLYSGHLMRGELPIDRRAAEEQRAADASLSGKVSVGSDAWSGELAIPISDLGAESPLASQVWGFNVVRRFKGPAADVAWSCVAGQIDVAPMEYGELRFSEPAVTVSAVEFGMPYWGANTATVTIKNNSLENHTLRLKSRVFLPVDEVTVDEHELSVELPAGKTRQVEIPYLLSWRGRWPIEVDNYQRIFLSVEDTHTMENLYAASFPVAYDAGLIPSERYGQQSDAPNPKPDDPDFIPKKRAYIIGRIPEFRREGRNDNDTDQLVLAAVDGSVKFDLMQPGVMQQIADWLYDRFDNDIDRLLGTMFFVHQRSVTRHSRIKKGINPLSVLRSGGGLDDDRVWAMAGILSKMKQDATGEPYRSHCLSTGGHVVLGVEPGAESGDIGDSYVFDPAVGVFHYAADNTRLATLDELRKDRQLSARMHFFNTRHGKEFYFQNDQIGSYQGEQRRIWPAGAPAW